MAKTNSTPVLNKDKSFKINLVLISDEIEKEYQNQIKAVAAKFKADGFRPGKAPLELVKANIDEQAVLNEVAAHLLSHRYSDEVTKAKLNPIIDPKITLKNPPLTLGKDWEFEAVSCELPQIKLKPDYKDKIHEINQKHSKAKEATPQTHLQDIIDQLVTSSETDLPQILIETELEYHLSRFVDQLSSAGLTVSQYFKNKGTTIEKYQEDLKGQITRQWLVNLAFDLISKDQKITLNENEVKETMSKANNPNINPQQISLLMLQDKIIAYLKSL